MADTVSNRESVSPTDGYWIKGYSKKHPGRMYYYNIVTREAKWELNDVEKRNIRSNTQSVLLEGSMEPKESPFKPIVNNAHANMCHRNFMNNCCHHSHHTLPVSVCQCNRCSSNNMAKYDLNIEPPVYNPAVWSVPPSHQIVISPTPIDLQTVNNYQNPTTSTCTKVLQSEIQENNLNNFNNLQYTNKPVIHRSTNVRLKYTMNRLQPIFNKRVFQNVTKQQMEIHDLRQLLSAKKELSKEAIQSTSKDLINANDTSEDLKKLQSFCNNTSVKIAANNNECFSDSDEEWLQKNIHGEGTQPRLDVTPLRKLAGYGTNPSCWYIVTDTNVLLEHLNFVDILVNSDEQCRLMVPKNVVTSLQSSNTGNMKQLVRIRHTLCFLKQQLDNSSFDDLEDSDILHLCGKLIQQSYHVVLLSDNEQLKVYKTVNKSIHIFTVKDIKFFLSSSPIKLPAEETITITVSNDANVVSEDNIKNTTKILSLIDKQTLDAEVQTDFEYLNLREDSNTCHNNNVKNEDPNDCITQSSSNVNKQNREIRLKRSYTSDTPLSNTDKNFEKRTFKWRKRRIENSIQLNSCTTNESGISQDNVNNNHSQADSAFTDEQYSSGLVHKLSESGLPDDNVYVQKECNESIASLSTSGISSNIYNSNIHENKMESNTSNETSKMKHVMFEVTGEEMEEYLKLKCDEWVSRFLQIMEEVLTQVLHFAPAFKDDVMPPPWTVHEAAECIKKKFSSDCDVVDAATKLSELLFKISNNEGKVKTNITPSEYMEMYSFGVYLLDSLQSVMDNCEDLQTGAESLFKLYSDISNPNVDNSNNIFNDSFVDNPQESVLNVTLTSSTGIYGSQLVPQADNNTDIKKPKITPRVSKKKETPRKPKETYNLRSSKTKTIQKETEKSISEEPVTVIRTIDNKSSFLSSLLLQRKNEDLTDSNIHDTHLSSNTSEPDKEKLELQNDIEDTAQSNVKNCNSDNNKVSNTIEQSNDEPKIIRNFTKCLEFEERLKNRFKKPLDLDVLDYNYYQNVEDEFSDDQYSFDDDDYYNEQVHDTEKNEDRSVNDLLPESSHLYDQDTNDNIYKLFIGIMLKDINGVFTQVHTFCLTARKELSESMEPNKIIDLMEKAKSSHLVIHNVRESLRSIINREENEPGAIEAAFRSVGVRAVNFTDLQRMEYRNVLKKLMDQASLLLEATDLIIKATNTAQDL